MGQPLLKQYLLLTNYPVMNHTQQAFNSMEWVSRTVFHPNYRP